MSFAEGTLKITKLLKQMWLLQRKRKFKEKLSIQIKLDCQVFECLSALIVAATQGNCTFSV